MQGTIIKLISNQYDVELENKEIVKCMARGKVRLNGLTPLAGDRVVVDKFDDKYGIEKILDRTNYLKRPAIANVDQALVVMSAKEPDFSAQLVDQLIFLISLANIKPLILVTKMDLIKEDDYVNVLINDYKKSGYTVLLSGKDEITDAKKLAEVLKGKITVLAGQSGVGKSSLLNRLAPDFKLETQEISKALGRGKHTTRHVEIFEAEGGGYIYDTPGFTSFDILETEEGELDLHFPEMAEYKGQCYFDNCRHLKEPSCAVREALAEGKIHPMRYKSYEFQINEIREKKKY